MNNKSNWKQQIWSSKPERVNQKAKRYFENGGDDRIKVIAEDNQLQTTGLLHKEHNRICILSKFGKVDESFQANVPSRLCF